MSALKLGSVVHTLGYVSEVGPIQRHQGKTLREITLTGPGGASISLTLWAKMAVNFTARHRVLAVRGARLKEYEGVAELSLLTTGTYEVEPKEAGVQEMVAWAAQLEQKHGELKPVGHYLFYLKPNY